MPCRATEWLCRKPFSIKDRYANDVAANSIVISVIHARVTLNLCLANRANIELSTGYGNPADSLTTMVTRLVFTAEYVMSILVIAKPLRLQIGGEFLGYRDPALLVCATSYAQGRFCQLVILRI